MEHDDRRQFQRVPIAIVVRYLDHEEQVAVMSRDVSLGGLFIGTVTPAPATSELDLHLSLPAPHGEVHARGTVVHCLRGIGMGIEFSGFTADGEPRLRRYLDLMSEL